jgi:hypothetical protein
MNNAFGIADQDTLPHEDIDVPLVELPDPEADNGPRGETLRQQEDRWTDLGLSRIAEGNTVAGASN